MNEMDRKTVRSLAITGICNHVRYALFPWRKKANVIYLMDVFSKTGSEFTAAVCSKSFAVEYDPNQITLFWTSYVGSQRDAARICCWAPAPAARRPQRAAAIDRYLLPTRHSTANPLTVVAVVDRWGRRTDRQTDARPLHRPCSAGSVNN